MAFDIKKYTREYAIKNREKLNEKARKWKRANPEKVREANLKWESANREKRHAQNIKRFGLSSEKYWSLFVSQRTACAICMRPSFKKRLAVDHCHESGKVRGLLCDLCNRGLGMFRDSPLLLRLAADYLEKHRI